MREYGEIVEIDGDKVVVSIKRSSACSKCGACQLGSHLDEMQLTIPNELGGEKGDYVELELSSNQVLKASAITYLIPLLALILGVALGYILGPGLALNPELSGAVLGLVMTIVAFLGIRLLDPVFRRDNSFSPKMINIIKGNRKGEIDNGK